MEFKPTTWIMVMVLVALIVMPAFFMNSMLMPEDEGGEDELLTPPSGIQPFTNQPKKPSPKPPANQPKLPAEGPPAD
jgi:hypothetical protein